MSKFLKLACILFKNGAMPSRAGDNRGKTLFLIVAMAFLPFLALEAFGLWNLYETVSSVHLTGALLAGLLTVACIAMIVFGILFVISTYYFADDTVLFLVMPIRPYQLLAAKFFIVLLFQYILDIIIDLPGLIVFGIRGGSVFYWINSAVVFVFLPLLPTVVCSIISVLIMAFSRFFHNKDRVKLISGSLAIAFAVGISIGMHFLGRSFFSVHSLLSSGNLMEQTAFLFPSNILAIHAITSETTVSLIWLAAYCALSIAAIIAFLWIGNQLYLTGVVGLTQSMVHKKYSASKLKSGKKPAVFAVALKDWRLLLRTPTFALNCVISALLVPVILMGSLAATLKGVKIPHADPLQTALITLVLVAISMMNMVSPTAISRDGQDSTIARYIPVSYIIQLLGKLLPGWIMSLTALACVAIPACFLFHPDLITIITVVILSIISVSTFNMFGLFIDTVFPKLDWDDETAAVKRNLNVAIEILVTIVGLAFPAFLMYKFNFISRYGVLFLFVYNITLNVISGFLLFVKGPMLFADIPEHHVIKRGSHQRFIRNVVSIIILGAAFIWVGWEILFVRTEVKITSTQVSITAGIGESSAFTLSQVKNFYLKDNLPPVSGKIGFAAGDNMRGSFIVQGLGRGHVYTETSKGPFLFVILNKGGFTILNFDDIKKTDLIYNTLREYTKKVYK